MQFAVGSLYISESANQKNACRNIWKMYIQECLHFKHTCKNVNIVRRSKQKIYESLCKMVMQNKGGLCLALETSEHEWEWSLCIRHVLPKLHVQNSSHSSGKTWRPGRMIVGRLKNESSVLLTGKELNYVSHGHSTLLKLLFLYQLPIESNSYRLSVLGLGRDSSFSGSFILVFLVHVSGPWLSPTEPSKLPHQSRSKATGYNLFQKQAAQWCLRSRNKSSPNLCSRAAASTFASHPHREHFIN